MDAYRSIGSCKCWMRPLNSSTLARSSVKALHMVCVPCSRNKARITSWPSIRSAWRYEQERSENHDYLLIISFLGIGQKPNKRTLGENATSLELQLQRRERSVEFCRGHVQCRQQQEQQQQSDQEAQNCLFCTIRDLRQPVQ